MKEKKKEEIAQNHIAVFSPRFYHILTCIYTVFSHDKAQVGNTSILVYYRSIDLK